MPSGRGPPTPRNSRNIATAKTSSIGVPPPTIHRQPTTPSSPPTISGPIQSPILPVERCMEMNRPRRAGNRCANSPSAGGCHRAVPAEATASEARISPYDGATDTRK